MIRTVLTAAILLVAVLSARDAAMAADPPAAGFTADERARILAHGPWPEPWAPDRSNRASGTPAAAAFGARLFAEPLLAASEPMACADCHLPTHGYAEPRPVSRGAGGAPLDRNAPGLLDVRLERWFGWDGAADSLWAQAIRPILSPREMAADAGHVARLIRTDPALACGYGQAFGRAPSAVDEETVLVDAGKALAAYMETLVSGRAPFDDFRDALARGDAAAMARYPAEARRGLALFVGRGRCNLCHFGPRFSNGEFADVGVPFFIAPGRVDAGRWGGIKALVASPYNRLGRYNDDPAGAPGTATRHVEPRHRNWGEFRVPSLRNVALTAPYMHDGSKATLADVVRHYSEIDEYRLHADGQKLLRRLNLTARESADLVAFLETLTGEAAPGETARDDCR